MSASFTLRARRSQHLHFGVAESQYFNTAHLPTPCECTNLGALIIQDSVISSVLCLYFIAGPCRGSDLDAQE